MATSLHQQVWLSRRVSKTSWALFNGDQGLPQSGPRLSDKTVQVTGTFGAGGSVQIEGSNDGGATWHILNDPQGTPLTFTAAKTETILENPQLIRPNVTAGDGTTLLNVLLVESSTA